MDDRIKRIRNGIVKDEEENIIYSDIPHEINAFWNAYEDLCMLFRENSLGIEDEDFKKAQLGVERFRSWKHKYYIESSRPSQKILNELKEALSVIESLDSKEL